MNNRSGEHINPFLDYLRFEKRYSAHTVRAYQDDLISFFDFLEMQFTEQDPGAVKPVMVRSWMAALREGGISPRSIKRKLSALKTYFKFLVRTERLKENPMASLISPKAGHRLPAFIPETDLFTLLASLEFTEDWKGLNAKMLIHLFYCTGMRLSELIQLKERQLDPANRQVKILGKGNKERLVPVSAQLLALVDEYCRQKKKTFVALPPELLVTEKGKKLYPKYAYRLINQYLRTIKTLERKSPHVLRHTFATHLSNQGAGINAVKELLGHASLASTQVYTHNSIEKLKAVYKNAHPREKK